MTTPAEKQRLVKLYGTLTLTDKLWVFRADPTKRCSVTELKHESKWRCVELAYDIIRDVKLS